MPSLGRRVRPAARGKFLYVGSEKLWVRGATYGAFRPGLDGAEYGDLRRIDRDFADMAANGLNAVRIPHTVPPRFLLDIAQRHSLRVMVGLSAEQYVGYLIDRDKSPDIEKEIRNKVRPIAGHPALLAYAIGNEIPAPVARLLGRARIERYLARLGRVIKSEDPEGLLTYVNYPSTEYLDLPFLDLVSFNVYLESQERFEAYLQRLQNLAGDRPLLMGEIGLDSLRNGEREQARTIGWQIRTAFASGCAGTFVFAWTDEWARAGVDVHDWAFGLTDRERIPKPALAAARGAFAEVPFAKDAPWPSISVVVCSRDGARTIRGCLDGLTQLEYPNFEVIVVDDGSTDQTAAIAREYGFRLISTENRGLSSARNTGLEAASGEIVAYIDDDAYPDHHWLTYLAATFMRTGYVGVGGPNIPPAGDGNTADCVANAPGGPYHVLISDSEAEHIPGCNMAFRKAALQAIGGFDPQFRTAGDDVDVCWRLRDRGWTLGFSPGAMVWHHRRNSTRAYWKQQQGYGAAEALLERKWPERYNAVGHLAWAGRLYGNGSRRLRRASRIYHGMGGAAPFQRLYHSAPSPLASLLHVPEWYLIVAALAAISVCGLLWTPLLVAVALLTVATVAPVVQAALDAGRARFPAPAPSRRARFTRYALTTVLHVLQPMARLRGRLSQGLTPWRRAVTGGFAVPRPRPWALWTPTREQPERRLRSIESALHRRGITARRGGYYDRWDFQVRGGAFGVVRLLLAVEDHGGGAQYVRARSWPVCSGFAVGLALLFASLAGVAMLDGARAAAVALATISGFIVVRTVLDCGAATAAALGALESAHAGRAE